MFAFGKPWFSLLEDGLGLQVVDRLGVGGRQYSTEVPSRAVLVLGDEDSPVIIAEPHVGVPAHRIPPRRDGVRKAWFSVGPPVSGCACGVAPAAADERDELTAASSGAQVSGSNDSAERSARAL